MIGIVSRIFTGLCVIILITFSSSEVSASEASVIKNILKIKTYNHLSDGSFVFSTYGSAIAIDSSHVLTNAHVVLDSQEQPFGNYEICFSDNFEKPPVCRDIAKLVAYDTVADLAILKLQHTRNLDPFELAPAKLSIGSYVSMYGYPGIGGETITRTEGKIAGFEQSMYKIDGSIDHGNSGGGAFNSSGELVGMPTAVASDNSSLGYMVSIKRIQEFLNKKTTNYEIYTEDLDPNFIEYIDRNQSFSKNAARYKWNDVTVRNPRTYGFYLKNSVVSSDNSMIYWNFVDMYDRVNIILSCTNDAGGVLGWEARLNGFQAEKSQYPNWDMSMLNEDQFLSIYSVSKGYKPNLIMYYKNYDACFIDMEYQDTKKDAKLVHRATQFIKNGITFSGKYVLKNYQDNQYFSIKNTNTNIRIIRSINQLGSESILLGLEIPEGNWLNAPVEGKRYHSLGELSEAFGVEFDTIKTWNDYIGLATKSGIDPSRIQIINLGNNQKGFFYSAYNPDKKTTSLNFEYSYKTSDGMYGYITWSVAVNGMYSPNISEFEMLFSKITFPGYSILQ